MSTVEIPTETIRRLQTEADRLGITVEQLIAEFAAGLPLHERQHGRRKLAFVGIGASDRGITDRIDDLLADGFGRD